MRRALKKSLPIIDNKYALLTVSMLFIAFGLCSSVMTAVMIRPLEADLNLNMMDIAWLTTAFYNTYIISQFPLGILIDRVGAITVLRISMILAIISMIWFANSHSFYSAAIARALCGIAISPAIASSLYIGSHSFPSSRFVLIVGISESIAMLAAAVSESILVHSVSNYGWRTSVYFIALFGFAILIGLFIIKPDKPAPELSKTTELRRFNLRKTIKAVASSHVILNGFISGLLFSLMMAFAGLWCIPFLENKYQLTNDKAAMFSSLTLLGSAMCAPILGFVVRTVRRQYRLLLIGAIFANLISVLIIAKLVSITYLPLLLLILGVFGCVYVIPFSLVKNNCPKNFSGTIMAVVNLLSGAVGALVIVPIIGYLIDGQSGPHLSIPNAVWLFPISIGISIILILLFKTHLIGPQNPEKEVILDK